MELRLDRGRGRSSHTALYVRSTQAPSHHGDHARNTHDTHDSGNSKKSSAAQVWTIGMPAPPHVRTPPPRNEHQM